jgi:hypothetical protein
LTFPDNKYFPAGFAQYFKITMVAEDVAAAFGLPEDFAGLGDYFAETAIMHMPETAMDENYFFV